MLRIFVTGTPRSGTTLVDKLLSAHRAMRVYSQPLPLLYVEAKRAFMAAIGQQADGRMALNDMAHANSYPPAEFRAFLARHRFSRAWLQDVVDSMADFDGQYTKPGRRFDCGWIGDDGIGLASFIAAYLRWLCDEPGIAILGAKEVMTEEFIPYLLAEGALVVQMLRDPRDVLTSLIHGDATFHAGRIKPHLFNLRQWRKSIAFALHHHGQANFLTLRFEDLIADPASSCRRITEKLGLEPIADAAFDAPLRDQRRGVWRSNSSHRPTSRIDRQAVGTHRRLLGPVLTRFVEACCYAEMTAIGYRPTLPVGEVRDTLATIGFDEDLQRPELEPYLWTEDRRREELSRWRQLSDGGPADPAQFPFPEVATALHRGLTALAS